VKYSNTKILFVSFIILTAIMAPFSLAEKETTKIQLVSYLDPAYVLDKIKTQPYFLYFAAGKYYYNKGNPDKSLEMFNKAVDFNPDYAPSYHNIGVIHYDNADYDLATESLQQAIEIDPKYEKAYYSLGILLFELGRFDEAIPYFEKFAEMQPENPNANFDLAQSYVAKFRKAEETVTEDYDDLEQALYYLKKTQLLEPEFPYLENNIQIIESILRARQELLGDLNG
jgi:tetratricopeptide (TPR) repeat protein